MLPFWGVPGGDCSLGNARQATRCKRLAACFVWLGKVVLLVWRFDFVGWLGWPAAKKPSDFGALRFKTANAGAVSLLGGEAASNARNITHDASDT